MALAASHVAAGALVVARQKAIVAQLKAMRVDSAPAERTLDLFISTQRIFEEHWASLMRDTR